MERKFQLVVTTKTKQHINYYPLSESEAWDLRKSLLKSGYMVVNGRTISEDVYLPDHSVVDVTMKLIAEDDGE